MHVVVVASIIMILVSNIEPRMLYSATELPSLSRFSDFLACYDDSGGVYVEREIENVVKSANPYMVLVKCIITGNKANTTGGAVFTSEADLLAVCCNCKFEVEEGVFDFQPFGVINATKPGRDITMNPWPCKNRWPGNKAIRGEGGDLFATLATEVYLHTTSNPVNCKNTLKIANHSSGEDLESITMILMDAFGQPAIGQPDMFVGVTTDTNNAVLRGNLDFKVNTITQLTGMNLRGRIGTRQTLTLLFNPSFLPDVKIEVELRDCLPGEEVGSANELCHVCEDGFYSFDTTSQCKSCPSDATCGLSTITPDDKFWHYTSRSIQIQKCMVRDACEYDGRTDKLKRQARDAHFQNVTLFSDDNEKYTQCQR